VICEEGKSLRRRYPGFNVKNLRRCELYKRVTSLFLCPRLTPDNGVTDAISTIYSGEMTRKKSELGHAPWVLRGSQESVGGFLGIGSKLVAVRYEDLQPTPDNKGFVLPGAS
jgi:hypothetical protein